MVKRASDSDGYTKGSAKAKKPSDKLRFEDYRFCRVELTQREKDDLREDYLPHMTPLVVLMDLALPGYKFTYSVSDDGHTHLASLTCRDASDPNAGLTITARAKDVSSAILVLGYKVLVLCGDRSWTEVEFERGGSYDDLG